jgi:integrase
MPLTPKQVSDAIRSGANRRISDGRSLYLLIKNGKGFWTYRYRDGAKVRSVGLGSAATVTPAQARRARDAFVVARHTGIEMPGIRSAKPKGELFSTVRDQFLDHNASLWGERQRARNRFLLTTYAKPLDSIPVNRITTQQVADALRPIWTGPGDNRGGKLRILVEGVINGHADPNPATWERLKVSAYKLELKRAETTGHAAMPAADVPVFVKRLDMSNVEDRAILFVVLTGVRRQEAVGATRGEFDLINKRWLIPAVRMKNAKDHLVPLTDAAIACLGKLDGLAPEAFVFPSSRQGRMLGHDALSLRKFNLAYTLHGFRSTLTSWAEDNGYRTNVIQMMLAHRKKTDDGKALGSQDTTYMRATLFDERRALHQAWADYATGGVTPARPGELARTRWRDIDAKADTLTIGDAKAGNDIPRAPHTGNPRRLEARRRRRAGSQAGRFDFSGLRASRPSGGVAGARSCAPQNIQNDRAE